MLKAGLYAYTSHTWPVYTYPTPMPKIEYGLGFGKSINERTRT